MRHTFRIFEIVGSMIEFPAVAEVRNCAWIKKPFCKRERPCHLLIISYWWFCSALGFCA